MIFISTSKQVMTLLQLLSHPVNNNHSNVGILSLEVLIGIKIICFFSVEMSLEAHGHVQVRTHPGAAVTGFLSSHKKEFNSETDAGK